MVPRLFFAKHAMALGMGVPGPVPGLCFARALRKVFSQRPVQTWVYPGLRGPGLQGLEDRAFFFSARCSAEPRTGLCRIVHCTTVPRRIYVTFGQSAAARKTGLCGHDEVRADHPGTVFTLIYKNHVLHAQPKP